LNFFNPGILWFLPLVVIPVLIHMFFRRRLKIIPFPAVIFLKRAMQRTIRRLKIYNLLLLLLRIATLLFLILSFARPYLLTTDTRGDIALNHVIIIDDSMSMLCNNRWGRALKILKRILNELPSSARVAVFTLVRSETPVIFSENKEKVFEEIIRLNPVKLKGNLSSALLSASNLLKNVKSGHPGNIVVISDMGKNNFKGITKINYEFPVYFIDVYDKNDSNLYIENMNKVSRVYIPGIEEEFKVRIHNNSTRPAQNVNVIFCVNKRKMKHKTISISPFSARTIKFKYKFLKNGMYKVAIKAVMPGETMTIDNVVNIPVNVADVVYVLTVNGKPSKYDVFSETYFLNFALNPLMVPLKERGFNIMPVSIDLNELGNENLNKFAVIIFANVPSVPDTTLLKLKDFVYNGGGLLIFTGDLVDIDFYNTRLKDFLCGEIGKPLQALENSKFKITDVNYSHPAFSYFEKTGIFKNVEINTIIPLNKIEPDSSLKVLARFSSELPAIIESNYGLGKVVTIFTNCQRDWSNLPISASFVPFVNTISHYLGFSEIKRGSIITTGERFAFSAKSTGNKYQLISFENHLIKLIRHTDRSFSKYVSEKIYKSGFYILKGVGDFGTTETIFAANLPEEESDILEVRPELLNKLGVEVVTHVADMQKTKRVFRIKKDISDWLLYIALILFLVEFAFCNFVKVDTGEKVSDMAGTQI